MGKPLTHEQVARMLKSGDCDCTDCVNDRNILATIEMLGRELGASHYVLNAMGCQVNPTNQVLKQWIEWGKAQQKMPTP